MVGVLANINLEMEFSWVISYSKGFGHYGFSDLSLPLVYSQSKEVKSSISIADGTF